MERLMPPVKGRHLNLDLPVITDAASALQAMCEVARAVGGGEITTDDATAVAGIVEINRRTMETASLDRTSFFQIVPRDSRSRESGLRPVPNVAM
jgi:hypothetical protein